MMALKERKLIKLEWSVRVCTRSIFFLPKEGRENDIQLTVVLPHVFDSDDSHMSFTLRVLRWERN